jgi:5-methylcytosine-specific restriction endonuclease McrA
MWGFTRFEKNQVMNHIDEIRNALIELLTTSATFVDSITVAVGDKNKTQFRFELWHETLKDIVQSPKQGRAFNSALRRRLFELNPVCPICSQAIHTIDDAHADHVKPFVAGGATDAENAQLTHRYCNQQKSAKQT